MLLHPSFSFCSFIQCSVSCGYGIQSRTVSCMGPSSPLPVSPFLCLHLPKPITIQACYSPDCSSAQPKGTHIQSEHQKGDGMWGTPKVHTRTTIGPAVQIKKMKKSFSAIVPTVDLMESTMSMPTEPPQTS